MQTIATTAPRRTDVILFSVALLGLLVLGTSAQDHSVDSDDSDKESQSKEESGSSLGDRLTIEDILSREATDEDYDTEARCIDTGRVRQYDVLSDRFILIEMRNEEMYLIQFEKKCIGLEEKGTLSFDVRSSSLNRLCRNDAIRPVEFRSRGMQDVGAICVIPTFQKVTAVQVDQLKRGLASERVE